MRLIRILALLCMVFSFTNLTHAQSSKDNMIKEWERAKSYTKEYLDAMPDTSFSFKPTTEMRSFAEQMLHLSDANYGFGSAATGEKNPYGMGELEKTTDKSKAAVTKIVLAGYDFIINGIKKMTPAQLSEKQNFLEDLI